MSDKQWAQLVKMMSVIASVMCLAIGFKFSVDGFGILVPEYRWMGWLLGALVTMIEVIYLEEGYKHSTTIVLIGLLSYAYGIITNIVGIWKAQGSPDIGNNPLGGIFPLILGIFLEISPEPLFLYGFLGGKKLRDMLDHIFPQDKSGGGGGMGRGDDR